MSSRSRKKARDAKYTMGVDLAADGSSDVSATVLGRFHHDSGIYEVMAVGIDRDLEPIREALRGMSTEELGDLVSDFTGQPRVIEGTAVEVERRPERLLDAGGSEP